MNLRFQRLHPLAIAAAQFAQPSHIDLDAVVFQLHEHIDQRQFQIAQQIAQSCLPAVPSPFGRGLG